MCSVKEVEHLDWGARMRIIMGTAYCLQYMHHDLNPPVAHTNLTSSSIYLTDDYAAKVYIPYINSHLVAFVTVWISLLFNHLPCFCRLQRLFSYQMGYRNIRMPATKIMPSTLSCHPLRIQNQTCTVLEYCCLKSSQESSHTRTNKGLL